MLFTVSNCYAWCSNPINVACLGMMALRRTTTFYIPYYRFNNFKPHLVNKGFLMGVMGSSSASSDE